MLWRSKEQLVVQRADSFFLFAADGALVKRFQDSTYSDEDDLWITSHLIERGALIARTRIEGPYAPREPRDELITDGLEALSDTSLETRLLLSVDRGDRAAEAKASREADERVAKVDGGLTDLGLGLDAERARAALIHRIRAWHDERAAALLATLVEFSRVRPGESATTAFVRGCLLACYAPDVPAAPVGRPTPHPALAAAAGGHAQRLDDDAIGQEWADALRNAAVLRSAADAMRLAASLLS